MTAPRSIGVGVRSGHLVVVDERGVPIPPGQPIVTTADTVSQLLEAASDLGITAAAAGAQPVLTAAYREAIHAGSRTGARAGFDAGMQVGAKAGAVEGVRAGARYVLKNSRIRRKVERDEQGQITGSIEERVPE